LLNLKKTKDELIKFFHSFVMVLLLFFNNGDDDNDNDSNGHNNKQHFQRQIYIFTTLLVSKFIK
jgi:hypothetical protein